MHVAGRGRGGGIHVAVRIDPDQAQRLIRGAPHPIRTRGHRPGGHAVVAAEHQRKCAMFQRLQAHGIQPPTDAGDLVDVLLAIVRFLVDLWNGCWHIAAIEHRPAERGELIGQPRNPECGRAHVHAAPAPSKVERYADDVDRFHYRSFTETDIPSLAGDTMEVNSCGCVWIVLRNGSMSFFLLITLCAVNTAPGFIRGNTISKNFW